jgi:hypothetical protein
MGKITKKEWKMLQTKSPTKTNLLVLVVIKYCDNKVIQKEAWEILKTQNPNKYNLLDIINYSKNEEIQNEAREILNNY